MRAHTFSVSLFCLRAFFIQGDPAEYHEGGAWFEALKARLPTSESVLFAEQNHGFVPRGDISVPETRAAVDASSAKTFEFFAAHM